MPCIFMIQGVIIITERETLMARVSSPSNSEAGFSRAGFTHFYSKIT